MQWVELIFLAIGQVNPEGVFEQEQAVHEPFVGGGNTHAGKDIAGGGAAHFGGHQHFGRRGAFGIGQATVLVFDQKAAQRHHVQNTQDAEVVRKRLSYAVKEMFKSFK